MIFVRSDSPGIFPLKEQTHAEYQLAMMGRESFTKNLQLLIRNQGTQAEQTIA